MFDPVGRRTDAGSWVYSKLTYEPLKDRDVLFKHIYLAKHRTISTITTFVSVRGFERKLQVAYRVHLLNAWYIVIFMGDN